MSSRPPWAWGRRASDSDLTTQWTHFWVVTLSLSWHPSAELDCRSPATKTHMVILSRSTLAEQTLWTRGLTLASTVDFILCLWLCWLMTWEKKHRHKESLQTPQVLDAANDQPLVFLTRYFILSINSSTAKHRETSTEPSVFSGSFPSSTPWMLTRRQ